MTSLELLIIVIQLLMIPIDVFCNVHNDSRLVLLVFPQISTQNLCVCTLW